jgi:cold shock CspA family protein
MRGNIYEIKNNAFGFITAAETSETVFFHKNDLTNCTIYQLEEGDTVEFDLQSSSKGLYAVNVRKLFQASEKSKIANPGINPNVKLNHFNDDEKKIIQFFSKMFYVTSGGEEFRIGESTYRYCLIKPTEFFNRTFQLTRELVVVFSDYVSFEPRSLDAAAYAYKRVSSALRLDRGCHLLVCHDDLIEDKLPALLKDSNLNQIVVPFTYREILSEPAESLVQERFKKYLFDTDLFSVLAPIQSDVFFFGRRDFAHDIASKCKNSTHSGVFGLRRSGKTSLLYAVQRLLKQQEHRAIFIPCESLSSLNWRTALCKVVLDVYQEFGLDTSSIHEADYRTQDTAIFFEEDMYACLKNVTFPLTLMFDEIEAITFGVAQGEDSKNIWYDGEDFIHFWNVIKGYY